MNLTPYHAKYFAHELTKRCSSDSAEKLAGAVASAQVDLRNLCAGRRFFNDEGLRSSKL